MRKVLGKTEVTKTLGFASHSVLRSLMMFSAAGYSRRVSMNPLYPTYKTIRHRGKKPSFEEKTRFQVTNSKFAKSVGFANS